MSINLSSPELLEASKKLYNKRSSPNWCLIFVIFFILIMYYYSTVN